MMTGMRYISYLLFLCIGVMAAACGEEHATATEWNSEGHGDVTLSLKVSIGNTKSLGGTRADEPSYLPTDNAYELIHTLRVIIMRQDNTVEFNRMVNMPSGVGLHEVGGLEFDVSTSLGNTYQEGNNLMRTEKKRIYLVANEASIPNDYIRETLETLKEGYYKEVETTIPSGPGTDTGEESEEPTGTVVTSSVYVPGDTFLPSNAEKWIIFNVWTESDESLKDTYAVPMVDNEGTDKKFVPMSEFFDIDVTSNLTKPNNKNVEKKELFITRNLVKFQFELLGDKMPDMESFRVTDITFSSLRQKEYLFPYHTEYSPEKYNTDGSVNTEDKAIISYEIPGLANDGNMIRDYVFTPENFGYNSIKEGSIHTDYQLTYNPELYFCESKTLEGDEDNPGFTKFKVAIGVELNIKDPELDEDGNPVVDEEGNPIYQKLPMTFEAKPLDLPEMLPRNTIVKVKMRLANGELSCEAMVVPYIGVELNPDFGSDELIKPPKPRE